MPILGDYGIDFGEWLGRCRPLLGFSVGLLIPLSIPVKPLYQAPELGIASPLSKSPQHPSKGSWGDGLGFRSARILRFVWSFSPYVVIEGSRAHTMIPI